ncbi:hypothetical protein B0H13DRAFT_1891679 [Mycena leptocephala]|nr:hypothetical protein B0H13DRAFT_1891679 [Mycena leptocephala]
MYTTPCKLNHERSQILALYNLLIPANRGRCRALAEAGSFCRVLGPIHRHRSKTAKEAHPRNPSSERTSATGYAGVGVTLGLSTLAVNPLPGPSTTANAVYPAADDAVGVGKVEMVVTEAFVRIPSAWSVALVGLSEEEEAVLVVNPRTVPKAVAKDRPEKAKSVYTGRPNPRRELCDA